MTGGPGIRAVIDARGLVCPMPLVRLRQALMVLEPGERARLLATDPQSVEDVREFCAAGGHALVESRREERLFSFVVAKADR